jgi:hypothetical protein
LFLVNGLGGVTKHEESTAVQTERQLPAGNADSTLGTHLYIKMRMMNRFSLWGRTMDNGETMATKNSSVRTETTETRARPLTCPEAFKIMVSTCEKAEAVGKDSRKNGSDSKKFQESQPRFPNNDRLEQNTIELKRQQAPVCSKTSSIGGQESALMWEGEPRGCPQTTPLWRSLFDSRGQ